MGLFSSDRRTTEHLDRCERLAEDSRREMREGFLEVKNLINRLEDKFDKRLDAVDTLVAKRHEDNQKAIRDLWRVVLFALATLVGALAVIAEHGGIAGLVRGL
jgi:hypothetical protein